MNFRAKLRNARGLQMIKNLLTGSGSIKSADERPEPNLSFQVANSKEDFEGAFKLLYNEYLRMGYIAPNEAKMRVTAYHALPNTSVLVAKWEGRVVATISVIKDNAFGMPLEKTFDVQSLKRHGARLAEISSLAIDREFSKRRILFPLLKFTYEYCANYIDVDCLLIAVHPSQIEFYRSVLLFQDLDAQMVERYEFVNDQPAFGAFLDLRAAYKQFSAKYGRKKNDKNLFRYFTELEVSNFCFPEMRYRSINEPSMSPDLLNYFCREKTDTFIKLSEREKTSFCALFNFEVYQDVLPASSSNEIVSRVRKQSRFTVQKEGRLFLAENRTVTLAIKDVSLNGLQAQVDMPIRFGLKSRMCVAIAGGQIADLVGWPMWRDSQDVYGFYIAESSNSWKAFISNLESSDKNDVQVIELDEEDSFRKLA